ncbi:MAG: MerR family transcriptional regulator [Bilifractor sp.]|jgi:DNA-binding transcriptional MerR regulator
MTIKEVSEKVGLSEDALRYYERVGAIPPVSRKNGRRNYEEEDLKWVRLAVCMRSAGLPIEALIEYQKLYAEGDSTILERKELLKTQREALIAQRNLLDEAIDKLDYKISRYEEAEKAGTLSWS